MKKGTTLFDEDDALNNRQGEGVLRAKLV
jgi:hypothetical protein